MDTVSTDSNVAKSSPLKLPKNFYIRFKFWPPSLDGKFHVCDSAGRLLAFFLLKAFKLKSEIHVYTDKTKTKEIMYIKSRNVIAFSAAYDVSNPETGEVYGIWRRDGMTSLIIDNWILSPPDNENGMMGKITEDSVGMALLRRSKATSKIANLISPKSYRVLSKDGKLLATFRLSRNPFIPKLYVTILEDEMSELVVAGAILLVSAGNKTFNSTSIELKI